MTTHRPYPEYTPSGVDWLGDIPTHWQVRRLRSIAQLTASNIDKIHGENERPVRLCNYTDVYHRRLITNDIEFMAGTATDEEIRRFSLRAGDVMFTKDSESFDDIGIPAVADVGLDNVVLGYHLMLARPGGELYGPFLAWFFTPQINRWQFEIVAKGVTRFGMPQSGFKDALVSLPPLDEQRAIAAFLDRKAERIDRFIAERRRMIALLEEQKQAIINQAVTRGLDPDVPMRPSGLSWLDDIPAHWDVTSVGRLVTVSGGMTPSKDNRDYWSGQIPWISPKDMKSPTISKAVDHISDRAVLETGLTFVPVNSVLIVVRGMILARHVPVAVTEVPLTINQDMKALIPREGVNAHFLAWSLRASQDAIDPLIDEAGHGTRRLPTPALMGLPLAIRQKMSSAGLSPTLTKQVRGSMARANGIGAKSS